MSESEPQTDAEATVTPLADEVPSTVPPTWRAILRELAVRPSKGKGQNFLTDQAIVARIADAAALAPDAVVVEVGPGLGILTAELLARIGAAGRLIAVELDRRLAAYIREEFAAVPALTVVEGDILRQSPAVLLAAVPDDAPYTLVANLPYNITSAVLRHFLDDPRRPTALTVMVQREVAERIVARPPEMSILAVAVQFYGTASIALRIDPGAFIPRPRVDSAVLRVAIHNRPPLPQAEIPSFFAIVSAGFGQKRKQLGNSLTAGLALDKTVLTAAMNGAGIDPMRRAETLDVADWLALHGALVPLLPR